MVLGRDFMKLAGLSLRNEKEEVIDIMNIEIDDNNSRISLQDMRINEDLSNEIKTQARNLFERGYVNAQRPLNPVIENAMKLTLTNDKPFLYAPRRLSYDEKIKLRYILDDLISKDVIREITSKYASPIVLTKKKNGEIRMCIDFRALNKITTRDNFPLPLIEDWIY